MGHFRASLVSDLLDPSHSASVNGRVPPCPRSRLAALGCALLLILALAPTVARAADAQALPMTSGWRYRWGDSPLREDGTPVWALESGDSAEWQPMEALREPPGRGKNTFLWLSIPMPQGAWPEPVLYLGNVSTAFEAYAQGQRIYASGGMNVGGSEKMDSMSWHLVPLPPGTQGQRVLLRIQSSGGTIGVSRAVQVGSRHELLDGMTRAGLAPFFMGLLIIVIAVVSAGTALVRREARMLVPMAVFSGGSGVMLLGASGLFSSLWNDATLSTLCIMLGSYCILPGLAWFVSDMVGEGRMRWLRRGAAVVSVPAALQAVLMLVQPSVGLRLMAPFVLYSVPAMLGCVGIVLVEAWRGDRDARILGTGLGLMSASLVHSTLPLLGWLRTTGDSEVHWGFLALALSLVGVVERRSALLVQALAKHTRQLEERRTEVRELAERMGSGSGELAAVAQQLRTSAEEQTSGISRQATALQQLEQTVEEIRQSSHVTADKARLLASSAETAEQVGRDGAAALERTLVDLAAIRSEVSEMASRILSLDTRTREISGIVDAVKTLADQSNMLAINAAIEAVRSGDSGKGFGVVAREMRSLADQSIQATHRIREVLDGLSASMREAATLSDQGEQRVRGSVDAVRASSAQLQKLAGIINDTSSNVRQITAAVAQQDVGTHQIAQAIQELSGQMQRTLKVVEETRTVTRSVQSLAESMSGIAEKALRSDVLEARAQPAR
ncbi:chemotaxis protein [Pyxidicoccus fallax]|uniref:Chemotaxis protein n=1 Tax=Pyxidicoccus fallax TaxID=394095 RepID=A0A848LTR0_9BACT|nr:methyl-accepting chemotaxis protein [Pyxidicoccus fallax]NMO21061.1 chemotaxis protein [Pyxidicoccus fallax]NPC82252.1 chemotaxis protein [Pyxidicoccus fallax]